MTPELYLLPPLVSIAFALFVIGVMIAVLVNIVREALANNVRFGYYNMPLEFIQDPDRCRPRETIQSFYRRVDPSHAEEGLVNLYEVHNGRIPMVYAGETLADYFHRTDPLF